MSVMRRMPLEKIIQGHGEGHQLKRVLRWPTLIMMGLGVIIGAGIFVLTGVAATKAGPALALSFVVAGVACACAGLCYAECGAMIPSSGSAYTFAYVGLGEIVGWFLGWCILLEYVVATAAVAVGWSGYFVSVFASFGVVLPASLTTATMSGGIFNIPAALAVIGTAWLLSRGTKESTTVNNILVIVKVGAVLVFIFVGAGYVDTANWAPFMPFGWDGVFTGAATVFFSYIGFDCLANSAEEVIDPKKDLPIGILGALAVVTILYIAVTLVMTGLVPYYGFENIASPAAFALLEAGISWGAALVSVSAVIGLIAGVMTLQFSATRVIFSMGRDGLLPQGLSKLNSKAAPVTSITLVAIIATVLASIAPIGVIGDLVNMGTIWAFIVVSLSVPMMRKSMPDAERGFKVPAVWFVALLGAVSCFFLATKLSAFTWIVFVCWTTVGLIFYFSYGKKRSVLGKELGQEK